MFLIETPRLLLRDILEADLPRFLRWHLTLPSPVFKRLSEWKMKIRRQHG